LRRFVAEGETGGVVVRLPVRGRIVNLGGSDKSRK
jgi:hypothetical protein